jgi:hypothetical protein
MCEHGGFRELLRDRKNPRKHPVWGIPSNVGHGEHGATCRRPSPVWGIPNHILGNVPVGDEEWRRRDW